MNKAEFGLNAYSAYAHKRTSFFFETIECKNIEHGAIDHFPGEGLHLILLKSSSLEVRKRLWAKA